MRDYKKKYSVEQNYEKNKNVNEILVFLLILIISLVNKDWIDFYISDNRKIWSLWNMNFLVRFYQRISFLKN